jgi:uncharacterized protein with gpF-like domain
MNEKEARQWLEITAKAEAFDLRDFDNELHKEYMNYLTGKTIARESKNFPVLYRAWMAALSGPVSSATLEAAREMAASYARKRANTLAKGLTQSDLKALSEAVASGLERGLGPRELARELDMIRDLDSNRAAALRNLNAKLLEDGYSLDERRAILAKEKEKLLKARRETIARTETGQAQGQGRLATAELRGQKFKVWMSVNDEIVRDDHVENQEAGAIPIDEPFPSGAMYAPDGVNCRCSTSYFTAEETAERAGKEASGRAEKMREKSK